jgi:TrmH family RNA methyltransferase
LIAATGLHYAVPVARIDSLPDCGRPLVMVDPRGEPLGECILPDQAVFAFGAEREGVSQQLMARASNCVSIPMTPGVSSLNLATAVSVVLYAWKLGLKHN